MIKNKKGVLTIEAALIMPLVIYIIFLMIFMFLLIYSRVYVSLSVDHVAAEVTSQWYSRNSDFDTVKDSKNSIIAAAFETAMSNSKKIDVVKTKLKNRIDSESGSRGVPIKVDFSSDVSISNYIVGQSMTIKTTCKYTLPIAGVFRLLGLSGDGTMTDTTTKIVHLSNNEANMRTIKYASGLIKKNYDEILSKIKEKFGSKGGGK